MYGWWRRYWKGRLELRGVCTTLGESGTEIEEAVEISRSQIQNRGDSDCSRGGGWRRQVEAGRDRGSMVQLGQGTAGTVVAADQLCGVEFSGGGSFKKRVTPGRGGARLGLSRRLRLRKRGGDGDELVVVDEIGSWCYCRPEAAQS